MKNKLVDMLEFFCVSRNPNLKTERNILTTNLDYIWFLSHCVMNVLSGVMLINKAKNEKFEAVLQQLSNKNQQRIES